ncbi:hypothetical protein GFL54_36575 [Rhizobium laguerreae]|uniref:hypothetical protein n=1 Tax=Rhizobium TaxID=379 RepID=UPI00143F74B4|nr:MULTISPECIES: hypothetical protein [Rhizobium]MBY5529738.1 hypothetical protein [Rhizobium leguminosarum]NKL05636.1 hypothetical protein [Rhizobium leguminosarum bv. viciae]NKM89604.1 hypothetical protein [Rhizobium laguerreae]UFW79860.1 hypothetical protein RlegSU303_08015 [Rhizobium leguminosarum bv. viciae]
MATRADWMDLDSARTELLVIWLSGGGALFLILTVQSIFGRYGTELQSVWSWFIPNILPTLSLMVGVIGATALSSTAQQPKRVKRGFFRLSRALSIFYLALIALTIMLEPFTKIPVLELYTSSNYFLGPIQGLAVAALGVLFVTQDSPKGGTREKVELADPSRKG